MLTHVVLIISVALVVQRAAGAVVKLAADDAE